MGTITFLTAGESHGKGLVGIIDGIPAGITLSSEDIDRDLTRRQGGYGRGGRMKIESDTAEILSGVRWGKTIGSPVSVLVRNRDWENWMKGMSPSSTDSGSIPPVISPRPGHADLAGAVKYGTKDIRNILERSSARETAMRVALGAIARKILSEFDIAIGSYVRQIGSILYSRPVPVDGKSLLELSRIAEKSVVRCPDQGVSGRMVANIDRAIKGKYSLGGIFTVFALGLPPGLGSHVQWDRKLDGKLAQAIMSIQAIKGVEIGGGFAMASRPGLEIMDEIYYRAPSNERKMPFFRKTNHAGGIEGGMTNGMPLVVSAAMKPIPTLSKPLRSVDLITKKSLKAAYERSDICAVPAAAVVGEAMVALTLADVFLEKFGGDNRDEIMRNFRGYLSSVSRY